MRRFVGSALCLVYGFALPVIAVFGWTLWLEHRGEYNRLIALLTAKAEELGLPPDLSVPVLAPAAVLVPLLLIWFIAGRRTQRVTWFLTGLNLFAVLFVGLVVIGYR